MWVYSSSRVSKRKLKLGSFRKSKGESEMKVSLFYIISLIYEWEGGVCIKCYKV